MYLVFKVFQVVWYSNKENPGVSWSATLSCPSMASNFKFCKFVSRSDLVLDADHVFELLGTYLVLQACILFFFAFRTKVAHLCHCSHVATKSMSLHVAFSLEKTVNLPRECSTALGLASLTEIDPTHMTLEPSVQDKRGSNRSVCVCDMSWLAALSQEGPYVN